MIFLRPRVITLMVSRATVRSGKRAGGLAVHGRLTHENGSFSRDVRAQTWPERNDPKRVHVLVRPEIVVLDVRPIARRSNAGQRKDSVHESLQVWVIHDALKVALEVDDIDQIKPHEGGEEAKVGLREGASPFADQPIAVSEMLIEFVQAVEQAADSFLVGRLISSKAGLVDAVVDRFVIGGDHRVNRRREPLRAEGGGRPHASGQRPEHADDVSTLVVDDGPGFFVPQHRNGPDVSFVRPVQDA